MYCNRVRPADCAGVPLAVLSERLLSLVGAEAGAPVPSLPELPVTVRTGRSSSSALTARPLAARLATKVALYRDRRLPARGGGGGGGAAASGLAAAPDAGAPEVLPTTRRAKLEATVEWLAEVRAAGLQLWGRRQRRRAAADVAATPCKPTRG